MRSFFLSVISTSLLCLQSLNAQPNEDVTALAQEAYIYGYPLVIMDATKHSSINEENQTQFNQFVNLREFPSPNFHEVVSPNADTLYSSAWLDLSQGPIVLSVPEISRYYLLPILDEWTNVIASIGTRTNGGMKGSYAIVGPNWTGTLPTGIQEIRSPTNFVWIIGRTETKGPNDYEAVHKIQDQYTLAPLNGKPSKSTNYKPAKGLPPVEQVAKMDGIAFFTKLSELLSKDAPPQLSQDEAMIQKMAKIGIVPGKNFNPIALTDVDWDKAAKKGLEQIINGWKDQTFARKENGWLISTGDVGKYGSDYLLRAIVAYGGLGANLVVDAVYPVTRVDSNGNPLSGENRYVMHFNSAPPVKGFWSVTMYDDQQFFVSNPINRYKIGSLDKLEMNPDGSFDIYIQKDAPGQDKDSNWLPAPSGNFNLILRLYYPEQAVLNDSWKPPEVKKVS